MSKEKTLAIGDLAPSFEVLDSTRAPRRLEELAAIPVILIFYRGHW
jgi:peroxiredoxin